jgi:hypothetical protein
VNFDTVSLQNVLVGCAHAIMWRLRSGMRGTARNWGRNWRRAGVVAELTASNRVTHWPYAQTEAASGLTWVQADQMVPLVAGWRGLIAM